MTKQWLGLMAQVSPVVTSVGVMVTTGSVWWGFTVFFGLLALQSTMLLTVYILGHVMEHYAQARSPIDSRR